MVLDKIPTFEEVKNWVNGDISPDSVDANTVTASDAMVLPIYPTLGGVPTDLPEGALVRVSDENTLYQEDGS